ncbi:unnamed protein product [Lampetra fluviatilis]
MEREEMLRTTTTTTAATKHDEQGGRSVRHGEGARGAGERQRTTGGSAASTAANRAALKWPLEGGGFTFPTRPRDPPPPPVSRLAIGPRVPPAPFPRRLQANREQGARAPRGVVSRLATPTGQWGGAKGDSREWAGARLSWAI